MLLNVKPLPILFVRNSTLKQVKKGHQYDSGLALPRAFIIKYATARVNIISTIVLTAVTFAPLSILSESQPPTGRTNAPMTGPKNTHVWNILKGMVHILPLNIEMPNI
jgi:hypothetical protein